MDRVMARVSPRRFGVVLVWAFLLAVTTGTIAAAGGGAGPRAEPRGFPDVCAAPDCGAIGTFGSGPFRGAILVELRTADEARVTGTVKWELSEFDAVVARFSSTACGSPYAATPLPGKMEFPNVVFTVATITQGAESLAALQSFRLFAPGPGGAQLACATARIVEKIEIARRGTSPPGSEGAIARFNKPTLKGLVLQRLLRTDGQARTSVAITGFPHAGRYTVFGSEAPCSSPHHAGDLVSLTRVQVSASKNEVAIETLEIAHEGLGLRSIRVADGNEPSGPLVACAKGSPILIDGYGAWSEP